MGANGGEEWRGRNLMSTLMKDMDSYLAAVPKEMRTALEQLRKTIRSAAPEAEETVSYGVPMFKLHGPLFRLPL
jgi:uncharacterized protein YdhG (YjbR/CyaY superfamily)